MAGHIEVDHSGATALAAALAAHGADAIDHASTADAALRAAGSSVTSSPVAGALAGMVERLAGRGAQVGQHVDRLGSVVTGVVGAVVAEDTALADDAERLRGK